MSAAPSPLSMREQIDKAVLASRTLQLFALVDSAASPRLSESLAEGHAHSACLFGYAADAPIAKKTPRLVKLSQAGTSRLIKSIDGSQAPSHGVTILGSDVDFDALLAHLKSMLDVQLEGIDTMYLAFWDPAILATLTGSPTDTTLHVPGPVLGREQARAFRGPIAHWWYFDRKSRSHDALAAVGTSATSVEQTANPIALNAEQVEQLVEAAVPDHLLQHIRQNQPDLLLKLPATDHYDFVRQQLKRARKFGLQGTGDLVNYVCLALAFGARFDEEPTVAALLRQVQRKELSFDEVMKQADEQALEASKTPPSLLAESTP
jgi:hypothetical protein